MEIHPFNIFVTYHPIIIGKKTQKPDECDMHTPKKSVRVTICSSKLIKDYIRFRSIMAIPHRRPMGFLQKKTIEIQYMKFLQNKRMNQVSSESFVMDS
jgi:hypothetical protein